MQSITTPEPTPSKGANPDEMNQAEVQTRWFMVEELPSSTVAESYPLDELLRRFPDLSFLQEVPSQALSGRSLIVTQGQDTVHSVRIYPDE